MSKHDTLLVSPATLARFLIRLIDPASRLVYRCFELGLILLSFGDVIEMTPRLIITKSEIDKGLDIFRQAIETL